jgi:hypothetical protein
MYLLPMLAPFLATTSHHLITKLDLKPPIKGGTTTDPNYNFVYELNNHSYEFVPKIHMK